MKELLKSKIRQVTQEDISSLPVFSYSKMDTHINCPYQYNNAYNLGMRSKDTSIALELGSLCHYVLEQKGHMLTEQKSVDYEQLQDILINGTTTYDEKTKEEILGVNALKKKYFDIWHDPDNASGMTYEEKMKVFDKVLRAEMETNEEGWQPYLFEHHFEFVWDNRAIIHGFIDRIDVKDPTDLSKGVKTVDYKTSKKIYDQKKLATSLQFGVYALAILNEFDVLPNVSEYRFILIDEKQYALTKGWEKRLIKAIDKIFDKIDECESTGIWKPSPTPLCHWCNYSGTNPNAHEYKDECEYFSLWTPTNKTFEVNKVFDIEGNCTKLKNNERKLVF